MNTFSFSKAVILGSAVIASTMFLFGCTEKNDTPAEPRTDLTTQTLVNSDGEEVIVQGSNTQIVKAKEATIRTNQTFSKIEESTITVEKNTTEATELIKGSTIIIEKGATVKTEYLKNSKVTVKKGGDLQVTGRVKGSEIILEGGTFSVRPDRIDEGSSIVE